MRLFSTRNIWIQRNRKHERQTDRKFITQRNGALIPEAENINQLRWGKASRGQIRGSISAAQTTFPILWQKKCDSAKPLEGITSANTADVRRRGFTFWASLTPHKAGDAAAERPDVEAAEQEASSEAKETAPHGPLCSEWQIHFGEPAPASACRMALSNHAAPDLSLQRSVKDGWAVIYCTLIYLAILPLLHEDMMGWGEDAQQDGVMGSQTFRLMMSSLDFTSVFTQTLFWHQKTDIIRNV